MPVLPFAHLALYLFCNLPLFLVFLEDPFLINPFCTIMCQSYILLLFLNGFYTPLYLQNGPCKCFVTVCVRTYMCMFVSEFRGYSQNKVEMRKKKRISDSDRLFSNSSVTSMKVRFMYCQTLLVSAWDSEYSWILSTHCSAPTSCNTIESTWDSKYL